MVFLAVTLMIQSAQDEARTKALQEAFETMEKAIRGNAEAPFKERWSPEGYEKNLTGRSGLSGKAVFEQGSRKKWYLKPDFSKPRVSGEGSIVVVRCDVWAWEREKPVDEVDLLFVREGERYVVLGGGEKSAEVDALATRYLKKEPLAPAEEKE